MRNLFSQVTSFMAILVMFTLMSCGGSSSSSSTAAAKEEPAKEEATEKKSGGISFTDEEKAALKDKFFFDEASGFYSHKAWNKTTPKRRTLTADVNQSGYYCLVSNYYGAGVNHSKVTVKIDGKTMSTEGIDRRNEAEHRKVKDKGGQRWEINSYTKYRDKGIFDAISKTEGPVMISFIGPDATTKYEEINSTDMEALKDCAQLSLLMRFEAAAAAAGQ